MQNKQKIYIASIDLQQAFDSIYRNLLWGKLESKGCPINLLKAIKELYSGTSMQVKLDQRGNLSKKIETKKGLKQGCRLAATLFSYYIEDMKTIPDNKLSFSPKINGTEVGRLLYADDGILLDQTKIGLKRSLNLLAKYVLNKYFKLNAVKLEIMVLGDKTWSTHKAIWSLDGNHLKPINELKYLGMQISMSKG